MRKRRGFRMKDDAIALKGRALTASKHNDIVCGYKFSEKAVIR